MTIKLVQFREAKFEVGGDVIRMLTFFLAEQTFSKFNLKSMFISSGHGY